MCMSMGSTHMSQINWMHFGCQRCDKGVRVYLIGHKLGGRPPCFCKGFSSFSTHDSLQERVAIFGCVSNRLVSIALDEEQ